MTTQEVADRLVALSRNANWDQAHDELYADDATSVEPEGSPSGTVQGRDALRQKSIQFAEMVEEFHNSEVSDPLVTDDFFSVRMKMTATFKGAPGPSSIEEICLYQVQDGKIVREEFFYTPQPMG